MTWKMRLLLSALLAMPAATYALGLGDIRLNSALNQPFSADIELLSATPDEVAGLRAALASQETFQRYGLDRPAYLSGLAFKVVKRDGRDLLQVRSQQSITEPFVTFLVEVNWSKGRLLREYTVLLDPPVFEKESAVAAPVAAPRSGEASAPAAGSIARSAPAASSAPAAGGELAAGEYRVQSNDTLSLIARRAGASGRRELDRTMIAIYRANPRAFAGNINLLRNGAVLQIPDSTAVAAVDAGEAAREVRDQIASWRSTSTEGGLAAAGGAVEEPARLKLVPPVESGAGMGAGTATADSRALQGRVQQLEQELAAAKRALEVRNAELARMQGQAAPPAAPAAPEATVPPPAAEPAAPAPDESAAAAEPTPPPAAVEQPKKKRKPQAEPASSSLFGDNLLYLIGGGAVLLLLGGLGYGYVRRRREADLDDALTSFDRDESVGATETSRLRQPEFADRDSMVVEESDDDSGEFVPPPVRTATPRAEAPRVKADDTLSSTLSSDTALNLDQADPLAEADFHMAYGLYDQAADIVKLAAQREPERRDLKLKLLEVYFVWGNKDAFLEVARDLNRSRADAAAGEWDKVVIMGKQIAPEDALFAGAVGKGAAGDSVDLNLEGGEGRVDLELFGAPGSESGIDLDLGQALGGGDSTADTGQSPALPGDEIDFMLDEPNRGADAGGDTTREMAARTQESPTIEQPRPDSPTIESEGLGFGNESPTVESPALRGSGGNTLREKIDRSVFGRDANTADQTAELAIDDLGFDLDSLESSSTSLEALEQTDNPADAETRVAGLDDKSRTLLARASLDRTQEARVGGNEPTQLAPYLEPTRRVESPLDLDLDQLTRALDAPEPDTVKQPPRASEDIRFATDVFNDGTGNNKLDLDLGHEFSNRADQTLTERIDSESMSLPELEPVTLSEVGTKLDLARAYMDMGDPDGARSILEEVLQEGSASQKTEAQRLIETLPG